LITMFHPPHRRKRELGFERVEKRKADVVDVEADIGERGGGAVTSRTHRNARELAKVGRGQ